MLGRYINRLCSVLIGKRIIIGILVCVKDIRDLLGCRDFLTKSERRMHGLRVYFFQFMRFFNHAFRERVDAADKFTGIVGLDLLTRVSNSLLQSRWYLIIANSEHNDLVVTEQMLLHSTPETDAEEFLTIEFGIIHRAENRILLCCLFLRGITIQAWCSRHIHTVGTEYIVIIVNSGKSGKFFAFFFYASCTMRLIADDEIEDILSRLFFQRCRLRNQIFLCLAYDIDGLIGRENNCHAYILI